jgi:2-hydroxyacyl-CoA lyase 1
MQGYMILAQALAEQKIKHCYGIVGVPVIELGFAIQGVGINYYGFRNEQQASYTAGYTGYLTGIPGVCLCVSGPGHTNAISGVANAWANCWPMLLISGSNDLSQTSKQAFQETDQVYLVKPYAKFSARVTDLRDIPYQVQKAVRASITGRPGPVFLDMPGDLLTATVYSPIENPLFVPPSKYAPDPSEIQKALSLLSSFNRPLIIVGKGCAYGHAEREVRELVKITGIPFLPTPMGKGVVADSHPLNISAARSTALKEANLIILLGARLNWILHFGLPPRFSKDVKLIQADICAEEMGHNV